MDSIGQHGRLLRPRRAAASLCLALLTLLSCGAAWAQWTYDVTLTAYPNPRWKALTTYVDKPTLIGDVTGDGLTDIVGVGVFGDVYCVDASDGRIFWTYQDDHDFELAIYICPAIVDVNCDAVPDVVSVTPKGHIIALDGRTGIKQWAFAAAAPIVFSPTAFDTDRNGTPEIAFSDVEGTLYLISGAGAELWKAKTGAPLCGTPALGIAGRRPVVVTGDRAGSLRCLDAVSGMPLWTSAALPGSLSTSPLLFRNPAGSESAWCILAGTDTGAVALVSALDGKIVWTRKVADREAVGDLSLADLDGDGNLDFACSTSGSRVLACSITPPKEIWSRKFKIPVKEYYESGHGRKTRRDVLAGEPVLCDLDDDGTLDVIVELRGLNNYIFGLRGRDGRVLWNYGNRNLFTNPALNESAVLSTFQEERPLNSHSDTVPVYSQPTPAVADFDRDGKADLVVNDRDEVGLIRVPLSSRIAPNTWAKYVSDLCNNIGHFSVACLGRAERPVLRFSVVPEEVDEGGSARLCWSSAGASELVIDQGMGPVKVEDCVAVSPDRTTTWLAAARGCGGEVSTAVTLNVRRPPPRPAAPPWRLHDVLFEYDWYRLTAEAHEILEENIRVLEQHPDVRVALVASCDERGSMIYNVYLAAARAASVREHLIRNGIDPNRIEVRPVGETLKWDSRQSETGWLQNRRVHFAVLP